MIRFKNVIRERFFYGNGRRVDPDEGFVLYVEVSDTKVRKLQHEITTPQDCMDGECVMNYTTVKVPVITMDELTKLQNEYMFFEKILKKLTYNKEKTPSQWFRYHELQRENETAGNDV